MKPKEQMLNDMMIIENNVDCVDKINCELRATLL